MANKAVNSIKQFILFTIVAFSIISCEKDIENVGVNLVENGVFDTQKYNSSVTAYNQNIIKRRASKLGQYLLGTYSNNDFGSLEASIITQLSPTTDFEDFGLDPVIDTVLLTLPYQATNLADANLAPEFELDSVWGNQSKVFNLNVFELQSYLNTLDPNDPANELVYYTDQTYNYNPSSLYSGQFKPDPNDTIMFVERPEVILDFTTNQKDRDTIRTFVSENGQSKLVPAIRLGLDEDYFINNFLPNANLMQSTSDFVQFFNGLYIQATLASDPASIMSLNLSSAATNITIYYTNSVLTNETIVSIDANGNETIISETDLNGDGDTVDESVPVRTKQSLSFNFNGITTNTYLRNYSSSQAEPILNNPNTLSGDEKLYLQGAAGSIGVIELFTLDDILELRNKNWLINEANLTFYVDQTSDTSIAPERLFVYNYDNNRYLTDIFSEGFTSFDGTLERDEDNNPYRYIINITDYISEVLKSDDPIEFSKLAVKVFNGSDEPTQTTTLDTEIGDYSWNPKGVVLHGNQSLDIDKRLKLEITYTEIN